MKKRPKSRGVDFDEIISDSVSDADLEILEKPLKNSTFYVVLITTVAVALIFLGRSATFAGLDHDRYIKRSEANINQEIPLIAARGIILDRNGSPLVENEVIFSVFLRIDEMVRNKEEEKVLDVAEQVLGLDRNEIAENLRDTNLESISDIILARDVTREQIIEIETRNLSSLVTENNYRRLYESPAYAHVIGYVGLVNSEDLKKDEELVINDTIGRSGLESYYDGRLRGINGSIAVFRDAVGKVEEIRRAAEPIAGDPLLTTIDAEFQEYFHDRMVEGLRSLGRTSGAGIAINPQNGEVLALVSLPSFDANNVSEYLNDPNQSLFNRAISGVYSPGSTIKPIHATAALSEEVIIPSDQIYSAGFIEIPNPYFPDNPSRFLDWKPHGWVDLYGAIARSSNVYFYTVGGGFEGIKGVGIKKLKTYWQHFGLDRRTGIDLPGEAVGFLPDPEEKEERTGSIWRIGDTYNVSIGQGDLRITPIELLNAISAISNNGKAFVPHIVKSETSETLLDLSWIESDLAEVREGMKDAVTESYGTAKLLGDLPITVAAKTGSAQTAGNTKTNALFVGYAPTDNPEIAVLVLIEDAREGSLNAIPIAKDVFGWYHENRLK